MVRGVEQECEEEDEASVPEKKNMKRMHKEKCVWSITCLFMTDLTQGVEFKGWGEWKFYKNFHLAVDYGVHLQYWWD